MKKIYYNNKIVAGVFSLLLPLSSFFLTGCEDMLKPESDLVEYEEDHTLNHATDSVYSVMGIINKMQIIADRVVLLGEVRGDLVIPTAAANNDLKHLSAFEFNETVDINLLYPQFLYQIDCCFH